MKQGYYQFRSRLWLRRLRRTWQFLRANIFKRSRQLKAVQRFLAGWLVVVVLAGAGLAYQNEHLDKYYLNYDPAMGGSFVEGMVGKITALNPMYADSEASRVASQLIFSGLFKYNGRGEVIPELAESYEVDESRVVYNVRLRQGLVWHDGEPLTAEDVAFTFQSIQDPNSRSYLNANWRDIKIEVVDQHQLRFNLPSPYSPFLNNLTTGIVPKHILGRARTSELRINRFNQQPVGAGPYRLERFSAENGELYLQANERYVHGRPRISRFVIKTFSNIKQLIEAQTARSVSGAGGFDPYRVAEFENLKQINIERWPIATQDFAFFNTEHPILNDREVRQALVQGVNLHELVLTLENQVKAARAPLLEEQPGYSRDLLQLQHNPDQAARQLEARGWKIDRDGIRAKDGQQLRLELVSENSGIYSELARLLQAQWQAIGVRVEIKLESREVLQQNYIRPRNYDILLFGITIGSDPDVYAFWHSSQVDDPGLNLSRYRSSEADAGLEGGRTRVDPQIRAAKYHTFLSAWRQDAPAVALIRPYYFYAARGVSGFDIERLAEATARFHNVHNWAVKYQPTLKRLAE